MNSNKSISLVALIVMTIVSFSNLVGLNIAGLSVIVGITFFFIHRKFDKRDSDGLDIKVIRTYVKQKTIWLWIALPLVMNIICFTLAALFLPEFIDHIHSRTEFVISFDKLVLLVLQLAVLALGEEIAWRAFFQKQLSKYIPIIPTIILTSIIFSLGHFAVGSAVIVSYDIFFIFINSVIYGVIFYKTNNAWISTISHYIANVFSILLVTAFVF